MLLIRSILLLASLALSAAAENLLVNGNFENGTNGFTSDYVPVAGGYLDEDGYDVVRSPHLGHGHGADFPDHSGGGLMLAANGSSDSSKAVWRATVAVKPFQAYAFSGWAASWGKDWNVTAALGQDPNPSQLQLIINGVNCGNVFQVSADNGQWKCFARVWNSGAATSAKIEIHLATTDGNGNDLALDDLAIGIRKRPLRG